MSQARSSQVTSVVTCYANPGRQQTPKKYLQVLTYSHMKLQAWRLSLLSKLVGVPANGEGGCEGRDLEQVLSNALHGFLLQQGARLLLRLMGQQAVQRGQGWVQAPILLVGQLICPRGCDSGEQGEELHGLKQGKAAAGQNGCGVFKPCLCSTSGHGTRVKGIRVTPGSRS